MPQFSPRSSFAGFSSALPDERGSENAKPRSNIKSFVNLVYLPQARLRKRSWQVDERIARQYILPAFEKISLPALTRSKVEGWLSRLAGRGLSPATCNRIFSVFRSVCSLAVLYGLIGRSPCAGIPSFRVCLYRERFLSHDEARRLMEALRRSPRQEARVLQLLLLTGARKSEILKARWEHVLPEQGLLTVPLSKSGRPRHITLSEQAMAVIGSIPRRSGCPWLFPGRREDRPLSDIYAFWDRLRRELGLFGVRIHDLRHTFASFLVNAGHSLYAVQRLLGHSDPRTTMRYAHLEQGVLAAAARSVSSRLVQNDAVKKGRPPSGSDRAAHSREDMAGETGPLKNRRKIKKMKLLTGFKQECTETSRHDRNNSDMHQQTNCRCNLRNHYP